VTPAILHSLLSQLVYGVVERGADDNVSAALLHVPGPGPWVRKTWPLNHKED
jgi:hypothetical protein